VSGSVRAVGHHGGVQKRTSVIRYTGAVRVKGLTSVASPLSCLTKSSSAIPDEHVSHRRLLSPSDGYVLQERGMRHVVLLSCMMNVRVCDNEVAAEVAEYAAKCTVSRLQEELFFFFFFLFFSYEEL